MNLKKEAEPHPPVKSSKWTLDQIQRVRGWLDALEAKGDRWFSRHQVAEDLMSLARSVMHDEGVQYGRGKLAREILKGKKK